MSKHPIRCHLEGGGRRGALELLPPEGGSLGTNRVGQTSTEGKNKVFLHSRVIGAFGAHGMFFGEK